MRPSSSCPRFAFYQNSGAIESTIFNMDPLSKKSKWASGPLSYFENRKILLASDCRPPAGEGAWATQARSPLTRPATLRSRLRRCGSCFSVRHPIRHPVRWIVRPATRGGVPTSRARAPPGRPCFEATSGVTPSAGLCRPSSADASRSAPPCPSKSAFAVGEPPRSPHTRARGRALPRGPRSAP